MPIRLGSLLAPPLPGFSKVYAGAVLVWQKINPYQVWAGAPTYPVPLATYPYQLLTSNYLLVSATRFRVIGTQLQNYGTYYQYDRSNGAYIGSQTSYYIPSASAIYETNADVYTDYGSVVYKAKTTT